MKENFSVYMLASTSNTDLKTKHTPTEQEPNCLRTNHIQPGFKNYAKRAKIKNLEGAGVMVTGKI